MQILRTLLSAARYYRIRLLYGTLQMSTVRCEVLQNAISVCNRTTQVNSSQYAEHSAVRYYRKTYYRLRLQYEILQMSTVRCEVGQNVITVCNTSKDVNTSQQAEHCSVKYYRMRQPSAIRQTSLFLIVDSKFHGCREVRQEP